MARAERIIHNGQVIVDGQVMNFEETVDLLCKTKSFLDEANDCLSRYAKEKHDMECQIDELKTYISELETELRVKEELFKIKSGLKSEEFPDSITIDGYKCQIIQTQQGLYISRDDIYRIIEDEKRELRERIEKQERRHQSDCITINQLHTTIDVLTDKLARLRGQMGL